MTQAEMYRRFDELQTHLRTSGLTLYIEEQRFTLWGNDVVIFKSVELMETLIFARGFVAGRAFEGVAKRES